MKKFLDCISVVGSTPSRFQGKKKYVSTGAVATTEIDESEVVEVTYEDRPSRANLTAEAGDILFAKMQGTRKTLLLDSKTEENIYSTGFYAVRANPEVITTECLYYLIDSELFLTQKDKHCSGATQKAITNGGLAKIEIRIPPLSEQGILTEKLRYLTQLIADKRKQLELFDQVIKSRFIEMFDCRNYPQVAIGELVTAKVPSVKKAFSPTDVIKYIDISSIDNIRNVMTSYTEYVLQEAPSRAQQHIRKGDIVISTVRPNLKNVAITTYEDENLVASSGFCVLRATECLPSYLMAIVCSDKFTESMVKLVTGANYPAIKDSDVLNYVVALPPIDVQNEFASFVEQTDKSKYHSDFTYRMEVAA